MSFFKASARLYELFGLRANRFRYGQEIGLVRFQETEERRQQLRLPGTSAQFVSPDSGQVEKPLRPTLVTERCAKRAKREGDGVIGVSVHRS